MADQAEVSSERLSKCRDGTMQFQTWLEALRLRVRKNPQRSAAARRKASRQRPVEALEERALLSVSSLIINGELSIISDADDSIVVRTNPMDGVSLQVIENGLQSTTLGRVLGLSQATVTRLYQGQYRLDPDGKPGELALLLLRLFRSLDSIVGSTEAARAMWLSSSASRITSSASRIIS